MGLYNIDNITKLIDPEEVVEEVLKDTTFNPLEDIGNKLPYTRRVSINDLVSEEYQQKLMAIDDTMSNCYWQIGDITNEIIQSINHTKVTESGKLVSKTDIFEAVGIFCHRSARSVRYYWECAHYFPPEIRHKYDVPFNVYAEARWVKDWEFLLQLSENNPMWSAEKVRAEYHRMTEEEYKSRPKPEVSETGSAETGSADLPLPVDEEVWTGQAPGRFKQVILSKLDHTADDLREVLDRIQLPVPIRKRIGEVLLEIQDISLTIRREV